MFDDVNFYAFREDIDYIQNSIQKAEEENWDERKLVSRINRKFSDLQRNWTDFEESWEENQPDHNLEIFQQYNGTLDEDRVHWSSNRNTHRDVKQGDDTNKLDNNSNQILRIEVRYIEDMDSYRLELEDDLYDLEIYSTKDDIQGIIPVLYDLASKFDFEEVIGLDRGSEEEVEFAVEFD